MTTKPRRFDDVSQRPIGYQDVRSSTLSDDSSLIGLPFLYNLAQPVMTQSKWCFPNRDSKPCYLLFDIIDDPNYGAAAYFESDTDTHWILFHEGSLTRLNQLACHLFQSEDYKKSIGLGDTSFNKLFDLREAVFRMSVEYLFRHEWMHVILGHTGAAADRTPLGVVAEIPATEKISSAEDSIAATRNNEAASRISERIWRQSGNRISQEHLADFFANTVIAESCRTRRFVFFEPDELPSGDDGVSLYYLAFLGAAMNFVLMALEGRDRPTLYPKLDVRLTTLFQAYLTTSMRQQADELGLDRILTSTVRDLTAAFSNMTDRSSVWAVELLSAMDSEIVTDEVLADLKLIEQNQADFMPEWAKWCVALAE